MTKRSGTAAGGELPGPELPGRCAEHGACPAQVELEATPPWVPSQRRGSWRGRRSRRSSGIIRGAPRRRPGRRRRTVRRSGGPNLGVPTARTSSTARVAPVRRSPARRLMKVIGAGLPRTATTTQMVVLEQLGFAPCYHMRDVLADLENQLPYWEAAQAGNPDWEGVFGDAQSTVDWPSGRFYADLIEHYPDAKVRLSVRDGEPWVRSMRERGWAT